MSCIYQQLTRTWATWYTPVTPDLIPTGELAPVRGTVFDLRRPTVLGEVVLEVPGTANTSHPGFDHNLVISPSGPSDHLRPIAEVKHTAPH